MATNKNTFWLEISGGADVLKRMSYDMIQRSTSAVHSRVETIYHSARPGSKLRFQKTVQVGRVKGGRGQRAYGIVTFDYPSNPKSMDAAIKALISGKDAGRV